MNPTSQRRQGNPQSHPDAAAGHKEHSARRSLKPRPAIVVRPAYVSQDNCLPVLGIVGRKFLERIVPNCDRVTRLGKTALVEIDEVERVIRELAVGDEDHYPEDVAPQPDTAAAVLAAIGREVAS